MFENLRANVTGAGFDTVQSIREALSSQERLASGKLRDDTRFEVVDTTASLTLVLKAPSYWKFVDSGRRAGSKAPPTNAIARWLKRKGSDANPFVVARAIGRRGIEPTMIYTDAQKNLLKDFRIAEWAKQDIQSASLDAIKPNNK